MKKRMISMLVAVVMLVSLLPTAAFAGTTTVPDYGLVLSEGIGYQERDLNDTSLGTAISGDALEALGVSVSGNKTTGYIYTFQNVNFATTFCTAVSIRDTTATLNLSGTNRLSGGDTTGEMDSTFGLGASGDLTITGSGSLDIIAGDADGNYSSSNSISVGGDLVIESGTVTATAGNAAMYSHGIYSYFYGQNSTTVTITGGTVTLNAGAGGLSGGSYGIFSQADDIVITGGTVISAGRTAAMKCAPKTQVGGENVMDVFISSDPNGAQTSQLPAWAGNGADAMGGVNYMKLQPKAVAPTPHEHNWGHNIKADSNYATVEASCFGEGACDYTGNDLELTILAPTLTVEGGSGNAAATLSADTLAGLGHWEIINATYIRYYAYDPVAGGYRNDYLPAAPTTAGKYRATYKFDASAPTIYVDYTIASASVNYDLWISGVQATSENSSTQPNWSYDSTTKVLTLKGSGEFPAASQGTGAGYAIYAETGVVSKIVLDGAAKYTIAGILLKEPDARLIEGKNSPDLEIVNALDDKLPITATAATITGVKNVNIRQNAIQAASLTAPMVNGALTITATGDVTLAGNSTAPLATGQLLINTTGDVSLSNKAGSAMIALAPDVQHSITGKDITISTGGSYSAVGGAAVLTATGDIIIKSEAASAQAPVVNGKLNATGANVTVTGKAISPLMIGGAAITATGDVTITNAGTGTVLNGSNGEIFSIFGNNIHISGKTEAPVVQGPLTLSANGNVTLENSHSTGGSPVVNGALSITKAKDVTITANTPAPILAEGGTINADGTVLLVNRTEQTSAVLYGSLTFTSGDDSTTFTGSAGRASTAIIVPANKKLMVSANADGTGAQEWDGSASSYKYMKVEPKTVTPAGPDYTIVLSGGKVYKNSDDPETNLLTDTGITARTNSGGSGYIYTFTNVNFETTASTAVRVAGSGATIELVGSNTIKSGTGENTIGICAKSLTISGSGSMTVTAGTATENSYGILVENDTAYIAGGTVTATGGAADDDSYGFHSAKSLAVTAGTLNAAGGNAGSESIGLYANQDLTLTGGIVIATGGNGKDSYGVYTDTHKDSVTEEYIYGNVLVTGGSLMATGGAASDGYDSIGLWADGNFTVSNTGAVTATGGNVTGTCSSYGLVLNGDTFISGGTVILAGNTLPIDGAPKTTNMKVMASTKSDGSDLTEYAGWKGDGSDGFNDYKYIKFEPAPAHSHVWNSAWVNTDATHHWHECTVANCDVTENSQKSGYREHTYTDANDIDCNDCGYERTIVHSHSWTQAWSKNDTHHWHECEGAGTCPVTVDSAKEGYAVHEWDSPTDTECICGQTRTVNNYTVTHVLTNITASKADGPVSGTEDYTVTLTAASGYMLPSQITVTIGGTEVFGEAYDYHDGTGAVTVLRAKITGNIVITAAAVKPISAITVTGVTEPVAGQNALFTATIPADADYYAEDLSGQPISGIAVVGGWVESQTADFMSDSTATTYRPGDTFAFQAGKYYTFAICLEAADGCAFTSDIVYSVNGKQAGTIDFDPTKLTVMCSFYCEAATPTPPTEIAAIAITGVTTPVAGQAAKFDWNIPADALYQKRGDAGWFVTDTKPESMHYGGMIGSGVSYYYTVNGNIHGEKLTFTGGKWYTFITAVTTGEEYLFSQNTAATMNGNAAVLRIGSDTEAFVLYSFYCTTPVVYPDPDPVEPRPTPADPKPVEPAPAVNPFRDVFDADWFYDDVMEVYRRDLMKGTDTDLFSPALPINRAMLVTILYRLEGQPAVTGENPFADVIEGQYYYDAVLWAAQNGIVTGYDGKYFPNDPLLREQFAAILYRYAGYKGYDVSVGENTNILSYNDVFDVSEYAIPAMQWACGEGIIGGYNGNLMPKGHTKRCEAAAMLTRFIRDIEQE